MYLLFVFPASAILVMGLISLTDDLTLWDWLPKQQPRPEAESLALIPVTEE